MIFNTTFIIIEYNNRSGMEKLISRVMWLLKQKNKMSNIASSIHVKDHEQFTNFLKSNAQFVNAAKAFHSWKEQMFKVDNSKIIEDVKRSRGPEAKGFKKR